MAAPYRAPGSWREPATIPAVITTWTRGALLFLLLAAGSSQAKLVEEQQWVSAKASDGYGREAKRDIMVTVFYDDAAPRPWPVLILNHGRSATAQGRADLGRAR